MDPLGKIHQRLVYDRRSEVLARALAPLFPKGGKVLDVGCGDGLISKLILGHRPDLTIEGIDVLIRPATHIPVSKFDGSTLPHDDASLDAVLFVDVLHHTADPAVLLKEAARVSRDAVVLKDHTRDGFLAGPVLHFMDVVGNARHGVPSPANYWPEREWHETFARLGLSVSQWTSEVPLYPWWASWVFGRGLHFVARLEKR